MRWQKCQQPDGHKWCAIQDQIHAYLCFACGNAWALYIWTHPLHQALCEAQAMHEYLEARVTAHASFARAKLSVRHSVELHLKLQMPLRKDKHNAWKYTMISSR